MTANGTAIRALREACELSVNRLPMATGCSQGYLSKLERGLVGASTETLAKIATYFDVPVTDLIKGDTVTTDSVTDADLRLYTAEQVEEMTGIPATWLKRKGGQRRIPCTYVADSRYLRFSAEDIRELIDAGRINPETGLPRVQSASRPRRRRAS